MFITSAHQICIQTSNKAGRILIGIGSPAPAYMYSQFDISETEARDFAAALIVVADSAKQASADAERINAQIEAKAPDLAEKLWLSDIDSNQQAAADYAADCRDNDY